MEYLFLFYTHKLLLCVLIINIINNLNSPHLNLTQYHSFLGTNVEMVDLWRIVPRTRSANRKNLIGSVLSVDFDWILLFAVLPPRDSCELCDVVSVGFYAILYYANYFPLKLNCPGLLSSYCSSVNIALFGSSSWHLGRKIKADFL